MSEETRETVSELREKIELLCAENEYLSMKQNRNRARSITIGTAFGGIVEIGMRSDSASVYAQIQPTEGVELIEQLAAGLGIEIAMRPKQDFASWRGWEDVIGQRVPLDRLSWKGAAAWQLYEGEELEKKYQENQLPSEKVRVQQLMDSLEQKENLETPKEEQEND
jgi:hypothetical protein